MTFSTSGHSAGDTYHPSDASGDTAYIDLVQAEFRTHGRQAEAECIVEDPKHPAGMSFKDGQPFEDEMYIFKDAPYSREKLHIILSVAPDAVGSLLEKAKDLTRRDGDYAISWCQEVEKGR